MQIAQNSVVAFHYTLTNDAGEVLDSSEGREPLTYLHGAGNIIPGLEKELEGRAAGDKLNVKVAPAEGYGEVQEQLMQEVPRDASQGVSRTPAWTETDRRHRGREPIDLGERRDRKSAVVGLGE